MTPARVLTFTVPLTLVAFLPACTITMTPDAADGGADAASVPASSSPGSSGPDAASPPGSSSPRSSSADASSPPASPSPGSTGPDAAAPHGSVDAGTASEAGATASSLGTIVGNGGNCLAAVAGGTSNGTQLELATCTGAAGQLWQLSGDHLIASGGDCLDVTGGAATNGASVQLWACDGDPAESWAFLDGNLVGIGGECLDPVGQGATPGTAIQIWSCWGGTDQLWTFCPSNGSGGAACSGHHDAGPGGAGGEDSGTSTPSPSNDAGITAPPQAVAAGYTTLAWDDEFDTLDISPTGGGNYHWYDGFPWDPVYPASDITVSGGILTINGAEIVSFARDGSTDGNAFQWAYFEASVQFDPSLSSQSNGWPSFWSFASEHIDGTDQTSNGTEWAENDFFEAYNSPQGSYAGGWYAETLHDWSNGNNTQNANNTYTWPAGTSATAFHKYGCLWVRGKITYYFDDQPGQTVTWQPGATFSILDQQHMALIIGTGDNWPEQVDWVRVWQ